MTVAQPASKRATASTRRPLLAVGIDAAEPSLVRALLDGGRLPTLAALLDEGAWQPVTSPADVGSGAVWPTLSTATEPAAHEICSYWAWGPQRMAAAPVSLEGLSPLWRGPASDGLRLGVVDVPFSAPGSGAAVEIVEWGAHDAIRRRTSIRPREIEAELRAAAGTHPFARRPLDVWAEKHNEAGMRALAQQCIDGARRRGALARALWPAARPDLLLLVFTEVHRASHALWHTLEDEPPAGALVEVYRAVDRELGELLRVIDRESPVVVFSLHGMRRSRGVRTTLLPLLKATGHAVPAEPAAASPRRLVARARRLAPEPLKAAYRRLAPARAVARLAGPPDGLPAFDWARTRAFPLPTDQHGWVRINLAGRERLGIVPPEEYERTCDELERLLLGLETEDERRVVTSVLRPSASSGAPPQHLPDLVVHWAEDVGGGVPLRKPAIATGTRAEHISGEHAPEGFLIARGPDRLLDTLDDGVEARSLLPALLGSLEV